MKKNTLAMALVSAFAGMGPVMGSAAGRPHIAPMMALRPKAAATPGEYELLIYGDIGESWWGESVTARSIVEQLNALPDGTTKVNGHVNSYGGSVADGMAIHNALRALLGRGITVEMTVDGVAMSSASLVVMAGQTVRMPESSILMIHAPWTYASGNASDLRQWASVLDTYADAMSSAYARKTGKPRDEMLALLLDGQDHYYTGAQALAAGFADELIDSTALADASAEGLSRFTSRASAAVAAQVVAASRLRIAPPAPQASTTEDEEMHKRKRRLQDPEGRNGGGGGAAPAPAAAAPDHAAVLAADQSRRVNIRALFQPHAGREDVNVSALRQQCEDDPACTVEAAGLRLLEALAKPAEPLAMRVAPGAQDETVNAREGMTLAVMNRINPGNALDERARPFAYFDLNAVARACCQRAGVNISGMAPDQIAIRAMHSTSDFPKVLENVITKSLRNGYETETRTFLPVGRRTTLPNFKEVSRVQLSGAPALKRVIEGGEYEYGTIGEGAEKYSVLKYGRLFAVTWETIINDDLDALSRVPQSFGAAAASLEGDLFWAIFTGNPTMSDGKELFHADHGNLGTATALKAALEDAPALDPIAEMRWKMLMQKGIEGRYITVRPRHLIVPPKLERVGQKITSPDFIAAKQSATNMVDRTLNLVVEPRLQDASATAYYGAADYNMVDTLEYAYLQGNEGVYTESKAGFEVDGLVVKARHVFGAKAIDSRGLFKNAGA